MNRSSKKKRLVDRWGKVISHPEEEGFLKGPEKFSKEIIRTLRILCEFLRGALAFRKVTNCVTVFGSARFTEEHEYYQIARETGHLLAAAGYTVMTGGGPGIMEAANRGAKEANGHSIGCNIQLPLEQSPNPYLDRWITLKYFFVRKLMLTKHSLAFVFMPGGFGTLDELFEMATLMQTSKIKNFPVALIVKDYWQPLINYMRETLLTNETVDPSDIDNLFVTDSPQEAIDYIRKQVAPCR